MLSHDDSNVKCVTVGPKMMSTLLGASDPSEKMADLRKAMEGIKSMRIISGDNDDRTLRSEAVKMLHKSRKQYSPYTENGKTPYGDCLWTRKIGKRLAELVYVAPENNSKGFIVMDFTGNIDIGFISYLLSEGKDR